MYAKGGCINYVPPKCHHPKCNHTMQFKEENLSWYCNKRHGTGRNDRHTTSISIVDKSQSPYLSFLNTKQLGEFIAFMVYYFNSGTSTEAAAAFIVYLQCTCCILSPPIYIYICMHSIIIK
eukprot:21248_1